MSFLVLRYTGHPAFFKNSVEMLKKWNPERVVQRPSHGVAVVLGVDSIEQLKGAEEDWAFDQPFAAEMSKTLGFNSDEADN